MWSLKMDHPFRFEKQGNLLQHLHLEIEKKVKCVLFFGCPSLFSSSYKRSGQSKLGGSVHVRVYKKSGAYSKE
jgi:hypothetical protein